MQKEEEEMLLSKVMFTQKLTKCHWRGCDYLRLSVSQTQSLRPMERNIRMALLRPNKMRRLLTLQMRSSLVSFRTVGGGVHRAVHVTSLSQSVMHCHQAMMLDFAGVDPSRQKSTHHHDDDETGERQSW